MPGTKDSKPAGRSKRLDSGKQALEGLVAQIKKPGKKWLWILAGVAIAAVVIAIIVVAVYSNTKEPTVTVTTQDSEVTSTAPGATTTTEAPVTTTTGALLETISDGTYLAGTDIPAGLYKGDITGASAYWQISTDANGLDIVASDDVSAQFYLEVEDGQFLKLRNVTITLEQ